MKVPEIPKLNTPVHDGIAANEKTLPQIAEAFFKRGLDLSNKENKFDEAANVFSNVIDCVGFVTSSVVQRGRCHWEMRRWHLARKDFNFAATIDPMSADIKWTKALLDLQQHDFKNGWQGYEARWGSTTFKSARLHTTRPQWEPGMECDHLIVWQEQGVGDQIIYSTFIPLIKKLVKRLTVMVDFRLVEMYKRSFPDVEFIGPTDRCKLGKKSAHLPMGSISQHFIKRLSDIPEKISKSYFKPDLEKRDLLRKAAAFTDDDFVIGISWISKANVIGPHKSISLEELLPFFEIKGVKFVNLQYSDVLPEIDKFEKKYSKKIHTFNAINNFMDLDGLASVIAGCDVVVSVSNATVHLAAAMGKPVFLLDANKLFFWNHRVGRESLWYPSVRIYPKANVIAPWTTAVEAAVKDLKVYRQQTAGLHVAEPSETFVFFHVGDDVSYPQKLVSSLRISNPTANIVMCTDKDTPEVLGVNRRVEDDVDRSKLMTERLRMYAAAKVDHPAIYLDTDMIVTQKVSPTEMIDANDIVLCQRSFERDVEFNPHQRGLDFSEYNGKTLMEVYPYLACTIVTKHHSVWGRALEILNAMDEKFHVWYGDQEALKVLASELRASTVDESDYGCLPEEMQADKNPKILHFKGFDRKYLLDDL